MSFQVRGPGWPVVALTTAAVLLVLGFSVSTQGTSRGRLTRVNGYEAAEGEVLVKYRDGVAAASHAAIEASADAESVEALDRRGARKLRSRRLRTVELLSLLANDPAVEYAEPNYVVRLEATPNDSSFPALWGLFNTGFNTVGGGGLAGADIDAPGAWDITTGSRANVVAIFDTGVDYNHPDLSANMWSAPSAFQVTVGGVTITCQAGTHGFNAITRTCDPMDDHYHGTHVAGTIGAVGNNGFGVAGVNWTASMMAIKFMGPSGSGYVSDAVLGMDFVEQVKAAFASTRAANVRVQSHSWGGAYSQSLLNAINTANSNDMLFVAAAGNNGTNNDTAPHYPSSFTAPNVVAVASSDNFDQRSSFSNYGATSVHLAAPGSATVSTAPGTGYLIASGTSMATPHVSGAAALALSMCQVSTAQLKALLLSSVDHLSAFSAITTSGGRLNARAAVQDCPYPKVTSLTLTPSVAAPRGLGTTVTWTALTEGGQGVQYRFYVWDGAVWTLTQDWSSANTFAWTPSVANLSYKVTVHVRSAWMTQGYELGVAQPFAIGAPASSVTLTSNLVAPQAPGTPVTWTASASGGQAPYTYRFIVWDGVAWADARAWGASNVFTWTPAVANPDFKVAVLVRSAWNTGPNEVSVTKPFAIRPFVTSLPIYADLVSPQATSTTVTFSASAIGGQGPYQYLWAVHDGVSWTTTQTWSNRAEFSWKPGTPGNYRVLVKARSAWNQGAAEIFTEKPFQLLPAATSVTQTPNVPAPQLVDHAVTFTAVATGGQGPYQYRWLVDSFVRRDWSTSNVFSWTPDSSGWHTVKVQARGASITGPAEQEAVLTYEIRNPLVLTMTTTAQSPRPAGSTWPIQWTASVTGGAGPWQFQWVMYDGTTWTNVTPWITSNLPTNVFTWSPTVPFAYRIAVRARSAGNTGPAEATVIQSFVIQ